MQPGYATPEGTQAWQHHHAQVIHPTQWRELCGCRVSPVGLGTYLGAPDAATDTQYERAILHFLVKGGNIIDCAINYRWQSSERVIGRALARAFAMGIPRESLFVATKGGFVPGDVQTGMDTDAYWQQLATAGIVEGDEIVEGCHCMAPSYLRHQVVVSRKNLGVETIDLYYLHNPETQLEEVSHSIFVQRLAAAFGVLEALVAEGQIRQYGCATWSGLRLPATDKQSLGLEMLLKMAQEVGGRNHHFRIVQAPFNLAMPEVMMARTQTSGEEMLPLLQAAERIGIAVVCSAPLMQSQLLRKLSARVGEAFPGYETAAARLLAFVINAPGVAAAMCGMKQVMHVDANWEVVQRPHLSADEWLACVRRLQ